MGKGILLSILISLFFFPFWFSRDPSPVRGLRRALVGFAIAVAMYVIAIVYILPRVS